MYATARVRSKAEKSSANVGRVRVVVGRDLDVRNWYTKKLVEVICCGNGNVMPVVRARQVHQASRTCATKILGPSWIKYRLSAVVVEAEEGILTSGSPAIGNEM